MISIKHLLFHTKVFFMDEKQFYEMCSNIEAEVRSDIEANYRERLEKLTEKCSVLQREYSELEEKYISLERDRETEPVREAQKSAQEVVEAIKSRRKGKDK